MGNCGSCDEHQEHDAVLELDLRKKEKFQSPVKSNINIENKENMPEK